MVKKRPIKVVKVPLDRNEIQMDYPQIFPKMPRMYLELIENKAKIKQDFINKEYIPSNDLEFNSEYKKKSRSREDKNRDREEIHSDKHRDREERHSDKHRDREEKHRRHKRHRRYEDEDEEEDKEKDKYGSDSDKLDKLLESIEKDEDDNKSLDEDYKHIDKNDIEDDKSIDEENDRKYDKKINKKYEEDDEESKTPKTPETVKSEENEQNNDEIYNRLNELLNDTASEKSVDTNKRDKKNNYSDKYSRHRDRNGYSIDHDKKSIPTLAELEAQGGYVPKKELRDINNVTMTEQQEEDAKRELIFKFELLKKSYPIAAVPEFTIHSDYTTMKKSYEDTVRRLSLDSSVENYKTYLIGGFMACEFVFGNFLGFDMQGFTQQQILSMHSYEKLLIELGEKSYVPTGSKFPVEIRLLFLILINAGFFVMSKMIMKKTGANLMGMINSMNSANSAPSGIPVKKKRMKGPNVNLDDLPDANPSID